MCGTSRKENDARLPIHPLHFDRIEAGLRAGIFLERGYGERFGMADAQLAPLVAGVRPRQQLIAECDVIVLPKPTERDIAELREGQVLWGWPHCVQDYAVTQLGIDRLTLIAWEAMNYWTADGGFGVHVFHMNNELAGYCSVLHSLQLLAASRGVRAARPGRCDQLRRDRPRGGHRADRARDRRRDRADPP